MSVDALLALLAIMALMCVIWRSIVGDDDDTL